MKRMYTFIYIYEEMKLLQTVRSKYVKIQLL